MRSLRPSCRPGVVAAAVLVALAPLAGCKDARDRASAGAGRSPRATARTLATIEPSDVPLAPAPPLKVVFEEQGGGVAHVAVRDGKLHVVHAGKAGRAVRVVDQVAISPDGRRIAYSADVDGAWRMDVDGTLGVESSAVGPPVFSPDSRHLAYDAQLGTEAWMVVDGVKGPARAGFVGAPVFSADSARVAFAEIPAEQQPARLVVSDLSLRDSHVRLVGVTAFVANPARSALAAVVEEDRKQRVVTLGFDAAREVKRGAPYDAIPFPPVFGADGASLAYVAEREGRAFVVLDGKEEPLPEGSVTGPLVIRPGSRGVGLLLATSEGVRLHEAFVRQGGRARHHEEAAELTYGPDGRHAYAARRGESWFVVVNAKEGPPFDRVVSPVFSPDGTRLAYRVRKDGKRFVVVADAEGKILRKLPPHEQVFPVQFTADGKSVAYGVKDGLELAWKVEPL